MAEKEVKKLVEKARINCIKEYYKKCPYIDELAKINVDYLNVDGKNMNYWSLEQNEPITIKKNVLGEEIERKLTFTLAVRSFFNPLDDENNISNLNILENIAEWTRVQNKAKIRPTLNEREFATSIRIIKGPYLFGLDKSMTMARYELQGELIYEKRYE